MRSISRKPLLVFLLLLITCLVIAGLALAAEVVSVEVVSGTPDAVIEVPQGQTVNFSINLKATGNLDIAMTSTDPSTAKINTTYSVTKKIDGTTSGGSSSPSNPYNFWSNGTKPQNPVTWTGYATPYSVPATASASSDAKPGPYEISIATVVTNPIETGGNLLKNSTPDTLKVQVTAVDNTPPVVDITAPEDGAFYKSANVPALAYTATDNSGIDPTVVAEGWSDEEGPHEVTVTATDAAGNEGSDSITYTVDNTPPVVDITAPEDGAFYKSANVPALAREVTDNLDPDPTVVEEGYSTDEGEHTVTVTATDAAGNEGSDSITYTVDNTPPVVNITSPQQGATYTLLQVVNCNWTASDGLSGLASVTCTKACGSPIDTCNCGSKNFCVTAVDKAGNERSVTHTYTVTYAFGGFLQPINADGSSIFKLGSTIPVKFQLKDANGNFVSTAVANISVTFKNNGIEGDELEPVSTSAATNGTLFRYSTDGNQYIFNLSTKISTTKLLWKAGTWIIKATLNDGTTHTVEISLKK